MVPVISDSEATIPEAAHLERGPEQPLARRINSWAQDLLAHGIAIEIPWVPEDSGIPGNAEADHLANFARDASGSSVIDMLYTSAKNGVRRISEGWSAAKVGGAADKRSNHLSVRLKGQTGNKRPLSMTSVKSQASRF
jgi:hypothetical protein